MEVVPMPDAAAPAAPAPSTPAAPATPAPAAPAINPSDAGRALAAQRSSSGRLTDKLDERRAALDKPTEPPKTTPKPDDQRQPTTAERLELLRAKREADAERAKLERRSKDLETRDKDPSVAAGKAAIEAAKSGDFVGALKALGLTREQLFNGDKALFWQLSALAEQAEGDAEKPDPAKIAADTAKKVLEDTKKADQEAAEAARVARLDAADEAAQAHSKAIDDSVATRMQERAAELPIVVDNGGIPAEWISHADYLPPQHRATLDAGLRDLREGKETESAGFVQRYVQGYTADIKRKTGGAPSQAQINHHLKLCLNPGYSEWFEETNGRRPTPDEILNHFEDYLGKQLDAQAERRARLRGGGAAPAVAPAAREAPRVPSRDLKADVGTMGVPVNKGNTLAERLAWRKAQLDKT
jgi:hypothetical protein